MRRSGREVGNTYTREMRCRFILCASVCTNTLGTRLSNPPAAAPRIIGRGPRGRSHLSTYGLCKRRPYSNGKKLKRAGDLLVLLLELFLAPFSLKLLPFFVVIHFFELFYVSIHRLPHCFTLLCLPAVHHEDGAERTAADHEERDHTSRRSPRHGRCRVRSALGSGDPCP